MKTISLSSGSKGNCTYIETKEAKILVDDGLSFASLGGRLSQIHVLPSEIDAILLTHEHSDHLNGIKTFLNKNKNAKVYIPAFAENFGLPAIFAFPPSQVVWFRNSNFYIKDATISAFILPHDSHFCVGYSILAEGKKVSVATDLGFVSNETIFNLNNSDILFFESNHDENLLKQNPKYTMSLKKRILSNNGHLSNTDCGLALVKLVKNGGIKQVVLSHLSEENNTPSLAYKTVKKVLFENGIVEGQNICVDVAFQDRIGTMFEI